MTAGRSDIFALLKADLSQNRLLEAAQLLKNLHPADVADFFEALDEDEKKKQFRKLDTDRASAVIAELQVRLICKGWAAPYTRKAGWISSWPWHAGSLWVSLPRSGIITPLWASPLDFPW